jgi:hypothetical protein
VALPTREQTVDILVAWIVGGTIIGLNKNIVAWAFLGGFIGSSWAPQVGRLRGVVMYLAACMLSALSGTVLGASFALPEKATWFAAAAISMSFYLLLRFIERHYEQIIVKIFVRIGIITKPGDLQ